MKNGLLEGWRHTDLGTPVTPPISEDYGLVSGAEQNVRILSQTCRFKS